MNCLYKICQQKTDPKLVKAVFELRMTCECGFQPQLLCCQGCGAYDGDQFCLDIEDGGCSAPTAQPKRAKPATWTRAHCLRCGTSSGRGQADLRFPHFGRQRAAAVCRGGAVRPGPYGQAPEFVKVFAVPPGVGPDQQPKKD